MSCPLNNFFLEQTFKPNIKYLKSNRILYLIKKRKKRENVINVNDQHIIQGKLFILDKGKLSVLHCIHELLLLFYL